MAGSRDWFLYASDDGLAYTVNLDESNAEALGFTHYTAATQVTGNSAVPKNMTMRFVLATNRAIPAMKRRFYVPTQAQLANVLTTRTVTASTYPDVAPSVWDVTTYQGERRRNMPVIPDTGLNDGDLES